LLSLSGDNATESTTVYCFNTCDNCAVGTDDLVVDNTMMDVRPTVSAEYFDIFFNDAITGQLSIVSTRGELVATKNILAPIDSYRVDATVLATGMYFINLVTEETIATHRVVVTK